jgi:transmembrane sensor
MSGEPEADDRVREEAATWLARQRMGPENFDQPGFDAWMGADARHAAAYAEVSKAADLVKELKGLRAAGSAAPRRRFGWSLGAAALAAAAALLFVFAPQPPQSQHETAIAQIEQITLPDGSIVTLGAASRIHVRFSARERHVVLAAGEAFFQVTHDEQRPFLVQAGDARVRVVGTEFDVRRGAGAIRVAVAEGAVQLGYSPTLSFSRQARVLLAPGEQAEAAEHATLFASPRQIAVSQVSPTQAGAWRQGHLAYVDTSLAFIVADLKRYYAPGLRLSDPALGDLRLTASFQAGDVGTFLATLPAVAPVSVTRAPNGEVTISPSP